MNFIRTAFIILFVLVTVVTIMIRPDIHNPMIIENSDFQLTRISDDVQPIPVVHTDETKTVQEIQVSEPKTQNVVQQIVYDTPKSQPVQKNVQTVNTQPVQRNVEVKTSSTPVDKSQLEMLQKIIKNAERAEQIAEQPKPVQKTVQTPVSQPKKQEVKPQQQVAQLPKPVVKQVTTSSNPYMTEEEEIIAWNVWRSNIHNQIMRDSDIGSAFMGTIFSFSFVVDKFGNVSNIKVEAFPDYFMDIARDGVKPAIQRLQNKPILNFPRGTKRTSTVVEGKFAIGTTNRFSTPGEYSDYERVVH